MEVILIINGVLGAFTIYVIKDFHKSFKSMVKTVSELKIKFSEQNVKVNSNIASNAKRLDKLEETKNNRA